MIGNGGFGDVFIQDTAQSLFQYYLQIEQKTDITLTSPVLVDDEVINVSTGHGFTVDANGDNLITIVEGDRFEQASVVAVNADAITISIPSGGTFSIAAKVIRGTKKLNVDGSVSSVEAIFKFYDQSIAFVPVDITKVKITMSHTQAGDDGKFGGIAQLSGGGFYFRRINNDRVNLGNYINNKAFKDFGAVVEYTAKGPGGINSTEITFDMKTIFGQVLRLSPNHNDQVCGVNRNNLTTLNSFSIAIIGSFTQGEQ
jgi:hypothetical protein